MFKKILPSKKFVKIFLVLIFILLMFILFKNKISLKSFLEKKTVDLQSVDKTSLEDIINRDTDGDGIKDWEESLWGTDPYKTTSNPEGIDDSIYIEKKKTELANSNADQNSSEEPVNDTDVFARELFSTIVSLKQSNNLTTQNIDEVSKNLASNLGQSKNLPDKYKLSDISIITNPTKQNITKFNSDLQKIVKIYKDKKIGDELEIFGNSVDISESGDISIKNDEMQTLKTIGENYILLAGEMSKIKTPDAVSDNQLILANSIYKVGLSIKNMSNSSDNPIVGFIGVSQYNIYEKQMNDAFDKLANYLKINGMI